MFVDTTALHLTELKDLMLRMKIESGKKNKLMRMKLWHKAHNLNRNLKQSKITKKYKMMNLLKKSKMKCQIIDHQNPSTIFRKEIWKVLFCIQDPRKKTKEKKMPREFKGNQNREIPHPKRKKRAKTSNQNLKW